MYVHYKTKVQGAGSHNGNFNNLWIENLPKIDEELAKEYFFINFSNGTEFYKFTNGEYEEKLYSLFETFHILPKDDELYEVEFLEKILALYPPYKPNRIIYLLVNRVYNVYVGKKHIYYEAFTILERLLEHTRVNYFEKLFVLNDTFLEAVDLILKVIPKKVKGESVHHITLIMHILREMKTKKSIEKLQSLKNTVWHSHPYVAESLEKYIKLCELDKNNL